MTCVAKGSLCHLDLKVCTRHKLSPQSQYRRLTEFGQGFGPSMWQAEADTDLTLSALPATAVGQILLTIAKFC